MINQYNPYSFNSINYPQTFPQQQIPTANGRASVDNIKLAPNSSVLVADSCNPIVYKCVSDSLGNVTITSFDISIHKDKEQIKQEQIDVILADLMARIEKLESLKNESDTKWSEPTNTKCESDKTNDEYPKEHKQSTSNNKSNYAKQS